MSDRHSTITDLPADIEAAIPEGERTAELMIILAEARSGEFHDYKNQKYVCGKVASYEMLHKCNDGRLQHIMNKIKTGYYDEEADADDVAQLKKDWLEDGGTEETFNAFFGTKQ